MEAVGRVIITTILARVIQHKMKLISYHSFFRKHIAELINLAIIKCAIYWNNIEEKRQTKFYFQNFEYFRKIKETTENYFGN